MNTNQTPTDSPVSDTTEKVVALLRERDAISLEKYGGKTMDRTDLTASQWAWHLIEEQADGIKYAVRMFGGLSLLEEARRLIGSRSPNDEELDWIARHDAQFTLGNVKAADGGSQPSPAISSPLCWDCEHNRLSTCPYEPDRPTVSCGAFFSSAAVEYGDSPTTKVAIRADQRS